MGGGFAGYGEVAYRVVDAKYWGVPQRRKRVYAVADTGGESANEILFDRKGDEWNFRPRLPAGKAVAGLADDCYCWHERMVQAKSSGGGKKISPTR
ncbi:DNA cytosine methyltransferase [Gemmiger formicilis]|uniref:DNA cytosine methyltransferase n=1 Tax=Gemmiger formicilis TaxID=745368 RepID=UPI003AEFE58F